MVYKYLDASTGHITEQDDKILTWQSENQQFIQGVGFPYKYDCGYFIALGEDDGKVPFILSTDFVNLVKYARSQGCGMIRLDSDGEVITELPTHDW